MHKQLGRVSQTRVPVEMEKPLLSGGMDSRLVRIRQQPPRQRASSNERKRYDEGHRRLRSSLWPLQINGSRSIKCLSRLAASDDCDSNGSSAGSISGGSQWSQSMRNIENRSSSGSFVFLSEERGESLMLLLFAGRLEREQQRLRRISILLSLLLIIFGSLLLVLPCTPVKAERLSLEATSANSAAATTTKFIENNNNKHRFKSADDIRSAGVFRADGEAGFNQAPANATLPLVALVINGSAAAGIGQIEAGSASQDGDDNQSTNQSNSFSRIGSKIRSKRRSRRRAAAGALARSDASKLVFLDLESSASSMAATAASVASDASRSLNKCNSSSPHWSVHSASSAASTSAACLKCPSGAREPSASSTAPARPVIAFRTEPVAADRDLIGPTRRVRRQVGADQTLNERQGSRPPILGENQGATTGGDKHKHLAVFGHRELDGLSSKQRDDNVEPLGVGGINCMVSPLQPPQAGQRTKRRQPDDSDYDRPSDEITTHHNLIASNNDLQWLDDDDEDVFLESSWFRQQQQHNHAQRSDELPLAGTGSERPAANGRQDYGRHLERYKRRASPEKMQTIYFGGFFPWLTDEESGSNLAFNQVDQDEPPGPMINGEYESPGNRLKKQQQAARKNKWPMVSGSNTTSNLPLTSSATSFSSENRHQLGRFILPAVRLALDHINTNSSVLSSYKLEIVPRDTQVSYSELMRPV